MSKIKLFHNPRCSKSRHTLSLLEEKGIDFELIRYLETPPKKSELKQIADKLGLKPSEFVRRNEYVKLDIQPATNEEELLKQMVEHPILIERPIVMTDRAARIGRPPESVLDIL